MTLQRVLVTGGAGFLGSAISRALHHQGTQVTVLSRGSYPWLETTGIAHHRADLTNKATCDAAFAGQDLVIHTAALPGVWGPREDFVQANIIATENVLALCQKHGINRLVYTSSPSVVFGENDHENADNTLPYPEKYLAHYPETKAHAERIVLAANTPTLATISLRPHLIWGPEDPNLLPRLFDRARKGRLRIVGDGTNKVSLTYIDNAAAAHLQAANQLTPGAEWSGKAYFINDDEPVVLWTWLNHMLKEVGIPEVKKSLSPQLARNLGGALEWLWSSFGISGEPPMTRFVAEQLARSHWYSLKPAQSAFGYHTVIPPEEALNRTIAWWHQKSR